MDAIEFETRESIFGPVVPGRECGDCTACCTYTTIDTPELKKAQGVTCEHCTATGCGIYENRYPVCRSWQCLWKHIPSMPDEARPDRCGLMCVIDQPQEPANVLAKKYIRLLVTDKKKLADGDLLLSILEMFSQGDLPVWLDELDGEITLLYPSMETASAIIEYHNQPESGPVEPEVKQWLTGVRSSVPD